MSPLRRNSALMLAAVVTSTSMAGARASDWVLVSEGRAGEQAVVVLVDRESVRLRDGLKQAWTKWGYEPARSFNGKPFHSAAILYHADCANGEIGSSAATYFADHNLEGDLVGSQSFSRADVRKIMKEPVPDSVGASMLRALCGR